MMGRIVCDRWQEVKLEKVAYEMWPVDRSVEAILTAVEVIFPGCSSKSLAAVN